MAVLGDALDGYGECVRSAGELVQVPCYRLPQLRPTRYTDRLRLPGVILRRRRVENMTIVGEPRVCVTCTTRPTWTIGLLAQDEPSVEVLLERPECAWIDRAIEQKAQAYAVAHVVPEHLAQVIFFQGSTIDPAPYVG